MEQLFSVVTTTLSAATANNQLLMAEQKKTADEVSDVWCAVSGKRVRVKNSRYFLI